MDRYDIMGNYGYEYAYQNDTNVKNVVDTFVNGFNKAQMFINEQSIYTILNAICISLRQRKQDIASQLNNICISDSQTVELNKIYNSMNEICDTIGEMITKLELQNPEVKTLKSNITDCISLC